MGEDKRDDPHSSQGTDRGGETARMLARAEAAVADLARSYASWAGADIDKCAEILAATRAAPSSERVPMAREIHGVAHNIKGQGSSFGYPLMTRLGQSLCQLTRRKPTFSEADLDLVGAHIEAMRLVLAKEIRGDGGELGDRLGARLEEKVRAALSGPEPHGDASNRDTQG